MLHPGATHRYDLINEWIPRNIALLTVTVARKSHLFKSRKGSLGCAFESSEGPTNLYKDRGREITPNEQRSRDDW